MHRSPKTERSRVFNQIDIGNLESKLFVPSNRLTLATGPKTRGPVEQIGSSCTRSLSFQRCDWRRPVVRNLRARIACNRAGRAAGAEQEHTQIP